MAASLNEIYSPELVEVMNSVEFKEWMANDVRFPVESMLVAALLDPIPSYSARPSLREYQLSTDRKRLRAQLESYAKRFVFKNNK